MDDLSEFFEQFNNGWIVHCHDAEERNNVLRMLAQNGYTLGSCTSTYLGKGAKESYFLNPSYNGEIVSCYSGIPNSKGTKVIEYSEYIELFDKSYAKQIDVPNATEFSSMLVELLLGRECHAHV